ncbi:DUF4116 domain-containing protein [Rickettsiales bacterium]|nr:DUF4116 domain-containing protein [Rickettsiales bacterium]
MPNKITINLLQGDKYDLDVSYGLTIVADLKSQINKAMADKEGCAKIIPEQQRLVFNDRILRDKELVFTDMSDHLSLVIIDRDIADNLVKLRAGNLTFKDLPEELKDNREIILASLENLVGVDNLLLLGGGQVYDAALFNYISDISTDDQVFTLKAISVCSGLFKRLPDKLKNDRDFVLKSVRENGFVLEFVSEGFKCDQEVVLEAVKNNGLALFFAPKELRGDKKVVLEAIKECACAFEFASEQLKGDKDVNCEKIRRSAPRPKSVPNLNFSPIPRPPQLGSLSR